MKCGKGTKVTGSERENNKVKKKNNFKENVGCSLFYMTYELFLCQHVNVASV